MPIRNLLEKLGAKRLLVIDDKIPKFLKVQTSTLVKKMKKLVFLTILFNTACGNANFASSDNIKEVEQSKKLESNATVKVVEKEAKKVEKPVEVRDTIINQCGMVKTHETITQTVVFPATKECQFGENGNLPERDQYFQAQVEQVQNLTVPADHVICDIAINSKTTDLHYDDFFVLAIQDNILVSTNEAFTPGSRRDRRNKIYKWNFADVIGTPWGDEGKYCFGENSACRIPSHDRQGSVSIQIPKDDFVSLAVELFDLKQIEMKMVTLGDNDEGDCEHSRLELDLEMTIAPSGLNK